MGGFEVCNLPATYSWRSVPHIPHHSMETRTSFFWGVGVSTSLTRMSRRAWNWAARMVGVGFGEGDSKVVRGSWTVYVGTRLQVNGGPATIFISETVYRQDAGFVWSTQIIS
jgi:hypothetical protein